MCEEGRKFCSFHFGLVISMIAIISANVILLTSCSVDKGKQYVRDGKIYGAVEGTFRGRWWNYYERAISYTNGQFYTEAAVDLTEAIRRRDKDQRMARTYGMHFVDYFPHRELGIIYYEKEELYAARSELERSIKDYPSAKAQFYLDRVRKMLIQNSGETIRPPKLALTFKKDEIWTRNDPITLDGVAEDRNFITNITVNGAPLFLQDSRQRVSFQHNLSLPQGDHNISVVATNVSGKQTERRLMIHVDRQGPLVTLEELTFDQSAPGRGVTIYGSIYDEAGVSGLKINGQSIPVQEGVEVFFTKTLKIDKGDLDLVAQDRLGNQTSAHISILKSTINNQQSEIRNPIMLACAKSNATDYLLAGLFGPKDKHPPEIKLRGWTDSQSVFLEKAYIEGEVIEDNMIETLTINNHSILRRKGRRIFFNHLIPLKEGKNEIFIEATDEAGNRETRKITVIRHIPRALQIEQRLSLTILPFEHKGSISHAALSFQDNLTNALVNQNRFGVIERDKLDLILQEQNLSRTKLIDQRTALQLGRLAAARSVVTGSMIETTKGIEIVARMIDTETSEILATEDVYDEIKDLPALRSLAEGMAIKFHHDFPLVEGLVIQHKGNYVFTDLGHNKAMLKRRFIIFREEPIKHPATGKILGSDNVILGRARIMQVMPDMSKAEIVEGDIDNIKPLDKVITE